MRQERTVMKLSLITDEATQDFFEAVAFAKAHGLDGVELRSVGELPIDSIAPDTLVQWRQTLDEFGLSVSCLAGSFYKCDADDPIRRGMEMDKLERLCDAADVLGCDFIRGFCFFRPESGAYPIQELARFFKEPEALLRKRNKRMLLEADPTVNTSNHKTLAELLSLLDKDVFGAVYDPGNDLYDPFGEIPYPEGYEAIFPHLCHIHVKDAVFDGAGVLTCVRPGRGLVGWPLILSRLIDDGYKGWLTLEPHYRKNVMLTEQQMRLPQGSAFTQGGMEAAGESVQALREMLMEAERKNV